MTDTPPTLDIQTRRRGMSLGGMSIVWLLPLAALVIALYVAWTNYSERGPLIRIDFASAEGITPGETELRYRDVAVGIVEQVGFSSSLDQVQVFVRLDADVADFVDSDAVFWVVRPEVTLRGVTGLGTVLSGVYIQGLWDSDAGGFQDSFEALGQRPLNSEGRPGLTIRLRAPAEGGLTSDASIDFRGIEVGRLGQAEISEDGSAVEADAIIYEPHDRLITTSTRFWDTSGFEFSIGANGAQLDFSSLATLVAGGVSFGTLVSGGERAPEGTVFTVYPDEDAAQGSAFGDDQSAPLIFTAIFQENVPGLSVDAPVSYGGLRVGRVTSIGGIVDPDRFGDTEVRLQTTLQIRPERLGIVLDPGDPDDTGRRMAMEFFETRVAEDGLRARLVTASILTGGLQVELADIDDAPPALIDTDASPNPTFPTAPAQISDVSATAEGVFQRVGALPFEELMQSAIDALNSVSSFAASDDLRAVPADVRALLGDARGLIGAEGVQGLPAQLSGIADEAQTLLAALNAQDAVGRLTAAIDTIGETAGGVQTSIEGVPDLIERLNAIAANAEEVPLDQLANSLDGLLQSADRLIDTPQARDLPRSLSAALDELRAVLADLREGGVVENLNGTLASASEAADSIAAAADDLPAMIDRAQVVLDRASVTLQGYDANAGVGRELTQALREVERAATAISALARALERNPNSLLFGR